MFLALAQEFVRALPPLSPPTAWGTPSVPRAPGPAQPLAR